MSSTEKFFHVRKPPAVYKHGVLKRYAHVFGGKAGLGSRSVTFLDGYAGEGQYGDDEADDDGREPGSPLIFMEAARALAPTRHVRCIFVEEDSDRFAKLEAVVARHAHPETDVHCLHGSIDDHLETVLQLAHGTALLAFLDPFGAAIGFERVQRVLLRPGRPPTEVLLHWSLGSVRREGGISRKVLRGYNRKTFNKLDNFLGGGWWRHYFNGITDDEVHQVAEHIAHLYADRMTSGSRFESFHAPVRDQPDHKPKYNLMLFTGSTEGVWEFADACSYAWVDWNQAVAHGNDERRARAAAAAKLKRDAEREGSLFAFLEEAETEEDQPVGFDRALYELQHEDAWVSEIALNIEGLLHRKRTVRLIEHTHAVYGATIGMARSRYVKLAVKHLHGRGWIDDDGKDHKGRPDFHKREITRSS